MKNTVILATYLRSFYERNKASIICDEYSSGGYDDWFLPSSDEVKAMYDNLFLSGKGGFLNEAYWTSFERAGVPDAAYVRVFYSGGKESSALKRNYYQVRCARYF